MVAGRMCGDEQVFVGTHIAMYILLPGFNMFSAAQLIKADLLNYLKQKNLLRRIDDYSFF